MRFPLFFIALFVTVGCMEGAPVKNPFPNYAAIMMLWFIYYLITEPRRRRIRYWRGRRRLEDRCMRACLRNKYH